jgi:hypothetical protein
MTQGPVTNDSPVAVIEGPKGKAEIYEYLVRNIIEYQVKFNDQTKTFNNLGEAYIEAGELVGN